MDWELRVLELEARCNESAQDTVEVAAMKRKLPGEMTDRDTEGPNTDAVLRSRVAAYVGEKMVQQGHAPLESGEVEDADAQLD